MLKSDEDIGKRIDSCCIALVKRLQQLVRDSIEVSYKKEILDSGIEWRTIEFKDLLVYANVPAFTLEFYSDVDDHDYYLFISIEGESAYVEEPSFRGESHHTCTYISGLLTSPRLVSEYCQLNGSFWKKVVFLSRDSKGRVLKYDHRTGDNPVSWLFSWPVNKMALPSICHTDPSAHLTKAFDLMTSCIQRK